MSHVRQKISGSGILATAARTESIIMHEGDSAKILESLPIKYFDWIYIDADHTYAGVKLDIGAAKAALKPDGLLVFNDYIFWSHLELMPYGIIQAVHELCVNED